MEHKDPKEQNSAFSDFLGALGISLGKKTRPEPQEQEAFGEEAAPPPAPAPRRVITVPILKPLTAVIAVIILLFIAIRYFRPLLTEPKPPGEDVVASFNNRHITVSDLKDFIFLESRGRQEITIDSIEQYRQIIRIMAAEQIVQARAAQKGLTQRDDVQHNLQDLINDASIDNLVHQIAQKELNAEAIPKYEVQQYYDNNRSQYGERNFSDVEHEIRDILIEAKEKDFFPQYIEELKKNTGLDVNFELLRTLGTTDESMEQAVYLRGDESLFNVHGRRYTLKNFYTEFKELPAYYQSRFSDYETRRQLLEQFIAKELLLEETRDASEDPIEQHGIEDVRVQYLTQLLHQEEVEGRMTEPEEDEIRRYYEKNKKNFVMPARARVSLIRISEGQNGENREQARKRAREALAALKSGTEFAEAARLYSDDYTARDGGEVRQWVAQNHISRDLGKVIFALKTGETSKAINSQNEIFIFKINERLEEEQIPYDDIKHQIVYIIREEQHISLQQKMKTSLFAEAGFIIYDKTLRKLLNGKL